MTSVILQNAILLQIQDDYKKICSKSFKRGSDEGYIKTLIKDLDETFSNSKTMHAKLLIDEES